MVIVASIALATMVSNDLVMPLLLRRGWGERHDAADMATRVLWIRRVTIVALALCAFAYHRNSDGGSTLASYGLIAFAAVAQFAPGLIGGLYWRGASRHGVELGMAVGFATWAYTLLLPTLSASGWLGPQWLVTGPFGVSWLRPQQLFNLTGWDPLTHGTFWSLLLNAGTMMIVSARWRPSLDERLRIVPFLDPYAQRRALIASPWPGGSVRVSTWSRWPSAWSASATRCVPSPSRPTSWGANSSPMPAPTAPGSSSPSACWPRPLARPRRGWC